MNFHNRKGFALTEVLLSIAVILIVGVSAYGLYRSSANKAETTEFVNNFIALKLNVDKSIPKNSFFSRDNFNDTISKMGLVPDGFEAIPGPYGYDITYKSIFHIQVAPTPTLMSGVVASDPNSFLYMITEDEPMSSEDCISIISGISGAFQNIILKRTPIKVNGKDNLALTISECNEAPLLGSSLALVASDSVLSLE